MFFALLCCQDDYAAPISKLGTNRPGILLSPADPDSGPPGTITPSPFTVADIRVMSGQHQTCLRARSPASSGRVGRQAPHGSHDDASPDATWAKDHCVPANDALRIAWRCEGASIAACGRSYIRTNVRTFSDGRSPQKWLVAEILEVRPDSV